MKRHSNPAPRFAVCINNSGYPASLETGKLYRILPDEEAAAHGYIRVIDESGEDYGYSAKRFVLLELPPTQEKALVSALKRAAARSVRAPQNPQRHLKVA